MTPAPPEFQQSFSDTVGDTGTNTDGFDTVFLQAVSDLAQFDNLHAGLDADLLDIGSAGGDLNTPWEQDFSDSITNTITQGQSDFDTFNVHITGNTPPAPGTPPSGGGAGTLKITAATGPQLPCDNSLLFVSLGGTTYPESLTGRFRNPTSGAVKIINIVLVQPAGGLFTATTTCTNPVIPAGGECDFTVSLTGAVPDGTSAQLQVTTDFSSAPVVLCAIVNNDTAVGSGPPPPLPPVPIVPVQI